MTHSMLYAPRRTLAARMCVTGMTLVACLFLLPPAGVNAQTVLAEFTVHAGDHDRTHVPVSAELSGIAARSHPETLRLIEVSGGGEVTVPFQLRGGASQRIAWILSGSTEAGTTRTFELREAGGGSSASSAASEVGGVTVRDSGESLRIVIAGRPVIEYRYVDMPVPEGVDEIFSLSGYIHPLWSPQGEILTRIQPPDHYHHYGIWNPWTSTEFQGRSVDFWNVGSGQGRVRAERVLERVSGPVFGGFRSLHHHLDRTGPAEQVALNELWEVTVWNAAPHGDAWLIDFTSTLNPATDDPLTIREYSYQGFSLRATERWNDQNSNLLTSEGFNKSDGNATRARWIDVNGESDADGGTSGILFLTSPSNFNFPEQLRIWPVGQNRGVENVFINFNPAQDRDWHLEPGNSYSLRYRLFVYDGSIDTADAERLWTDFADPPRVDVRIATTQP